MRWALFVVAVVLATAWWIAATRPEMWLPVVALVTILTGLFYFAPLAYSRGERTQGMLAVLATVVLGPASLVILVPWALDLRRRTIG